MRTVSPSMTCVHDDRLAVELAPVVAAVAEGAEAADERGQREQEQRGEDARAGSSGAASTAARPTQARRNAGGGVACDRVSHDCCDTGLQPCSHKASNSPSIQIQHGLHPVT